MKVRHQQRARRPSAPTDLQTEMSDDEGSGNGWSGRLTRDEVDGISIDRHNRFFTETNDDPRPFV
jgi:hypothetical protein